MDRSRRNENMFIVKRHIPMNRACGVRSLDVKSTEVNTKKILKTRHFRELGVRFSSTLLNAKRTLLCYENKG